MQVLGPHPGLLYTFKFPQVSLMNTRFRSLLFERWFGLSQKSSLCANSRQEKAFANCTFIRVSDLSVLNAVAHNEVPGDGLISLQVSGLHNDCPLRMARD